MGFPIDPLGGGSDAYFAATLANTRDKPLHQRAVTGANARLLAAAGLLRRDFGTQQCVRADTGGIGSIKALHKPEGQFTVIRRQNTVSEAGKWFIRRVWIDAMHDLADTVPQRNGLKAA